MLGVVRICVLVCVCTSGESLVQLLLFQAVAMERHNSAVICPLLLTLGPVSTLRRQPMAFLTPHVHLFQLLLHYLVHVGSHRSSLTPTPAVS